MPGETVLVVDDSPTILKLVQLVLTEAGYHVLSASDGETGLHMARDERPDLLLLDYLLPDMTGYDVWGAMSGHSAMSQLPVVILSTRADEVGERFAGASNVYDSISKPFSPEALLAVVQHTLAKAAAERGGQRRQPARVFPTPAAGTRVITAADPSPDADVADLSDVALWGDMAAVPLPDVLTLLGDQEQTGNLSVTRTGKRTGRIDLHLRDGGVDLALAVGVDDEFLLGRFLVEGGHLTAAALSEAIDRRADDATPAPRLLGADLVQRGLITDQALRDAMTSQTTALAYELLRWNEGRFAFRRGALPPAQAAEIRLGLNVDALLLEGLRRVDEWRLIEREIHDFDEIFLRDEDKLSHLGRGKLMRDELAVLELINGRHTVKDVVYASRMGSFDVTKILYRLRRSKLVRRRVPPMAVP